MEGVCFSISEGLPKCVCHPSVCSPKTGLVESNVFLQSLDDTDSSTVVMKGVVC